MSEPETIRPGLLERSAKFFTSLAGVITAAVLLGGAITGAVAFVRGGEDGESSPEGNPRADLDVLQIDGNVDLLDYRTRPGRKHAVVGTEPNTPGLVFYVQLHIQGFKRETLHLRWFTYDPNGERRSSRGGSSGSATTEELFEPEAPINTQVVQVWVTEPGAFFQGEWESQPGHNYFVRFELFSGDVLLLTKDSPSFDIA